ncbi:MAG: hypothetical protein ACLP62_00090 [Acidimicrobiales bacterium]
MAVLDGGPMDGTQHVVDSDTEHVCIVMRDGQQPQYVRTDEFQALENGQLVLVCRWSGRYFGPK